MSHRNPDPDPEGARGPEQNRRWAKGPLIFVTVIVVIFVLYLLLWAKL